MYGTIYKKESCYSLSDPTEYCHSKVHTVVNTLKQFQCTWPGRERNLITVNRAFQTYNNLPSISLWAAVGGTVAVSSCKMK